MLQMAVFRGVKTLSAYATRRLIVTVILTLFLIGLIVATTKWVVDMSFAGNKTINTQQFAPEIGTLALSVTRISENEVMLNVTFSGLPYVSQPGYNWTVWVSKSIAEKLHETTLPEGLELVEGTLKVNVICPLPNDFLSFQAKLRAIADGEWIVYGRFSVTYGSDPPNPAPGQYYGWYCGSSTNGIKISLSNGRIVQLEKASHPNNPATQTQTGNSCARART